jgi:hypothetical protein
MAATAGSSAELVAWVVAAKVPDSTATAGTAAMAVSSAGSAAYPAARPVPAETEVTAASSEARACVVAREAKAV